MPASAAALRASEGRGVCVQDGRQWGFELGWMLGAFRRRLRPSLLVCDRAVWYSGIVAVWWSLPRLYGAAHARTTQTDRHGQGAESGEWMWTGAFRLLHYVLSCRPFVSCDGWRWRPVGRKPVFLLLVAGGVGWDRQMDRSKLLPTTCDSTLGE